MKDLYTFQRRLLPKECCDAPKETMTRAQWIALGTIAKRGAVSVKDIHTELGISSSAATQLVNGLVKQGYVLRQKGKTDARVSMLSPSKKAHHALVRMKGRAVAHLTKLFSALSDAELATYLRLNRKILQKVTQSTP